MSVSSNLMGGGWPKATPSITVVLGVGLCWPQVVLGVVLATCGVVLWVPVTKLEVVLCPLAFGLTTTKAVFVVSHSTIKFQNNTLVTQSFPYLTIFLI